MSLYNLFSKQELLNSTGHWIDIFQIRRREKKSIGFLFSPFSRATNLVTYFLQSLDYYRLEWDKFWG